MSLRRRRQLFQHERQEQSRRDFLWKGACAALTATGIASTIWDLRGVKAAAADQISASDPALTGDYKALVCIFLFGGNDGNNLLVPTDGTPTSGLYGQYAAARSAIALPQPGSNGGLVP